MVGSRGSRDEPFELDARGSLGRGFALGRLETGRGRGRVFAVEDAEEEVLILETEAVRGATFVVLLDPNPNFGPVLRCSVEADGLSRRDLAPAGSAPAARSLLDGKGRFVVTRGAGKRDIGRGMPRDLAVGAVFSSMVASRHLVDAWMATRDGTRATCNGNV